MSDAETAGTTSAGETASTTVDTGQPGISDTGATAASSSSAAEKPVSTRDALTKAFASAGLSGSGAAGDTRPAEKAAGAEKPAAGAGGKVAGTADPGAPGGDRGDGRTPGGQFAPKKPAADAAAAKPGEQAATTKPGERPQAGQDQQQHDGAKTPPPGWSVASKAAWDKLPEAVRADIAKREGEISAGFKQYEGLKPFTERVTKSGQTLAQALTAYTGIEDLIRRDIGGGLMHIAHNSGLTQAEAGKLFAGLAQRLGFQFQAPGAQNPGGSPDNQNPGAGPDLQQLLAPVLEPLVKEINTLKTAHTSQAEGANAQRLTASQAAVETFRQDPAHKFYDNLEPIIFNLLKGGVVERTGDLKADLKAAYDLACWQNPEIRELLIKERSAAEEKKRGADDIAAKAAFGVKGAPDTGARSPSGKPPGSTREALQSAFAQVGLGQ
jgi:hypothetical protein